MISSPIRSMIASTLKGDVGAGGGAPGGYTTLEAQNDSAVYVPLLIKGDDGLYRPLYGKTS